METIDFVHMHALAARGEPLVLSSDVKVPDDFRRFVDTVFANENRVVVSSPKENEVFVYVCDFEETMNSSEFLSLREQICKESKSRNEYLPESSTCVVAYVPSDRCKEWHRRRCECCFEHHPTDLRVCGFCGTTVYCDAECQKKAAEKHDARCTTLVILDDLDKTQTDYRCVNDDCGLDFCFVCGTLLDENGVPCARGCGSIVYCSTKCRTKGEHKTDEDCAKRSRFVSLIPHAAWLTFCSRFFECGVLLPEHHSQTIDKEVCMIKRTGNDDLETLELAVNLARLAERDCVVVYDDSDYVCAANTECTFPKRERTMCYGNRCTRCDKPVHPGTCYDVHDCDPNRSTSDNGKSVYLNRRYEDAFPLVKSRLGFLKVRDRELREGRMNLLICPTDFGVGPNDEPRTIPTWMDVLLADPTAVLHALGGSSVSTFRDTFVSTFREWNVRLSHCSFGKKRRAAPKFAQCDYCARIPHCGALIEGDRMCVKYRQCNRCAIACSIMCDGSPECAARYCSRKCKADDPHENCVIVAD